jgi:hypothetical protein
MARLPFSYECAVDAGFVMDPNSYSRVGYVTSLAGLGLNTGLATDLMVRVPYKTPIPTYKGLGSVTNGTSKVVGVIEKFEWNGSVGGSINIDFYVSQQNALQVKALQQSVRV